jgi:hypothetical protein
MSLLARFAMVRNQTPIMAAGNLVQKDWFILFYNFYLAVTEGLPQPAVAISLTASPMTYTAVIRGQAHIEGGTVSVIEFSRDGTNWYDTGVTTGFVQMDKGDAIRVTYSVAPTIVYFPM